MSSSFFGHRIIHLESVDSTNNYTAKVFKSGEVQSGAVIMADIQTNGRGQREKTWHSGAYENLTFSLTADINLWKINTLIDLNRLIAISLHSFFNELGLSPKIKWPNDIMINDKKVCGILIENFFRESQPKSIIGIGINVNQQEFEVPRATSLFNEIKERHSTKELLFQFIKVLNATFESMPIHDSEKIHAEYDKYLWKRNEEWTFNSNDQEFIGQIYGTTRDGNLIVNTKDEKFVFPNGSVKY
tara:strand:- start:5580 stop:6311 length:732 start_codon:yes stop_codon:yes gene_type:complete